MSEHTAIEFISLVPPNLCALQRSIDHTKVAGSELYRRAKALSRVTGDRCCPAAVVANDAKQY
jgi:hypothetical protein